MKSINPKLNAMLFSGYKINVVKSSTLKVSLSQKLDVSHEFRTEFNEWLGQFFGYTSLLSDGDAIIDEINKVIHVNQNTYNSLLIMDI